MRHNDFAYAPVLDAASLPIGVSIFADRAEVQTALAADVANAGLALHERGDLAAMQGDVPRPLGEIVIVDCPEASGAVLAGLARLDMRAARSGAQLVIATSVDALDAVFACCDQSNPQFLVDATPAEQVIALGRALARTPRSRLRELAEDERLTLLRLTEQVGEIAQRLEGLGHPRPGVIGEDRMFRFESPSLSYLAPTAEEAPAHGRPSLPDPRLVRKIIRQRELRARFFDGELFADPAWDMLLDLTAARAEHRRVSVTSLCIASRVPPTTALRWIGQMTAAGLLERVEDDVDRRRAFIALSDTAADAMARYFAQLGRSAAVL